MRKKRVNLSQLTKLEAERQSKLLAGELEEQLAATGQDSETAGAKAVMELHKQEEQEEQEEREIEQFLLEDAKRQRLTYWEAVCTASRRQMAEYDVPKGFLWGAFLRRLDTTTCALVLWFSSSRGKRAEVGMKICGEPKYDLNWIDRRIPDVLDQMDKIAELYENPKTKGGIYLPN